MARNEGRHRVACRTKIATLAVGLALAAAGVTVATTTGDTGQAGADEVDPAFFVDITTVAPNVTEVRPNRRASTGTFTVDCGRNENGHYNPDNFIAQPGVRNGAQHLHDYVGNLSTNADSTNESLLRAGTTCRNGDKSAYFWPVVRIDREDAEEANPPEDEAELDAQRAEAEQTEDVAQVECPDVASQLAEVPEQAMATVDTELDALDQQEAAADEQIAADPAAEAAVLEPLRQQRSASLDRISQATGQPVDPAQATCAVEDTQRQGIPNGDENSDGDDAEQPPADDNSEIGGNDGEIQLPESVNITFRGSPVGPVRAMPKFLRVLYGDAKQGTNGPRNARASWTCTGFEDRLTDKYPICPEGSKVERIHDFPSCWDGRNIDSANHRDHIVFPEANGRCKRGFVVVPQLRITLVYDIPRDVQVAGQYKVDSFPEESHNPRSDHDDFANVMSQRIMNRLVWCINRDRTCGE
ncbi:DUF1996 domain-containing protein [Amycolatopsis sp. 3B14]|uniref:DUF1996 domain-containing protein n=1 Tax=Amycolatopsis sp. 3B14 TaxID=3243600 RepID=UPI003D978FB5